MRLRRSYGAPVAAVSMSVEGETAAYAASVVANGGTVSDARVAILNTFIRAEKASGAWALTDDYWALWGENTAQALTSLKQRRLATAVNAPTFTADRGYAFDGISQYIDTGFSASAHAVAMTGTSLRLAVYERTNVGFTTFAAGTYNGSTRNLVIIPRSTGSRIAARANSDAVETAATVMDSRGLSVIQRSASTYGGYKNGTPIAVSAPASEGSALPTAALFIGAYSVVATPSGFRACSVGFVSIGAATSDAQNLAAYNAVQAFATAVGAQV